MRKFTFLFALLFVMACPFSRAQEAPDAAELEQMLHWFLQGASEGDREVHDNFWAEDLIYTSSAGLRYGKDEIMSGLSGEASSKEKFPATIYTADEIIIHQYGDMAIVAFKMTATQTAPPAPAVSRFLNSGTFLKRRGEWKVVNWQATKIPE